MAKTSTIHFALLAIFIISLQLTPSFAEKKTYIVYLGTHSHGLSPTEHDAEIATQSHYDLLGSVLGSIDKAKESVEYSYNKYINGFAATLTEDEAERIKTSSNVVSVFEDRNLELYTTRSWEFLGLEKNDNTVPSNSLWNLSNYGDGVIIGTLDTGVWPESESFNDQGLGPIPSKWKGSCMKGSDPTFKCNNKLIGAKYFHKENKDFSVNKSSLSPRDTNGHGTHTLSTAGGSFVNGANMFGFASGIAKGGSPKARVAAYKVCWVSTNGKENCPTSDILAGFEAAISDGVNILSASIGGSSTNSDYSFKSDGIAIASFHAVRQGVTVVVSAGNDGPAPGSVTNTAPWMFTIGASTMDRALQNRVYLGNSTLRFKGTTIGPDRLMPRRAFHRLVDAASAPSNSSIYDNSRYCEEDTLDSTKVKGAIVICERGGNFGKGRVDKGTVVKLAGGVGMILVNDGSSGDYIVPDPHVLPATHISYKDGLAVREYTQNTTNPTAYISTGRTVLGIKPAPVMGSFSSRGPGFIYPQILKPDVTAPGVTVLAAFTGAKGPAGVNDTRRVKYTIMSGTSMSCPHVSGVVGLLKSLHPEWSPAAIRSALMTTALPQDNNSSEQLLDFNRQPATPFAYGAGHINPNKAADPGLVYNLTETDYLGYLCAFYTENEIKVFSSTPYKCKRSKSILDFNYPSITVTNFSTSATLTRTVTNVGKPNTYKVSILPPAGIKVTVVPSTLKFDHKGEELTYTVKLEAKAEKETREPEYVFGSLSWYDGSHSVRSPIVVERV